MSPERGERARDTGFGKHQCDRPAGGDQQHQRDTGTGLGHRWGTTDQEVTKQSCHVFNGSLVCIPVTALETGMITITVNGYQLAARRHEL